MAAVTTAGNEVMHTRGNAGCTLALHLYLKSGAGESLRPALTDKFLMTALQQH